MPISLRSVCRIGRCRCNPAAFAPISNRAGGERIAILSTTWQTVSLMTPQDQDYRAFITELHRRMKAAGSKASLIGGIGTVTYAMAVAMLVLLAIAMIGLFVRALATCRIHRRVVSGRHRGLVCLDRSAASSSATGRAAIRSTRFPRHCCRSLRSQSSDNEM